MITMMSESIRNVLEFDREMVMHGRFPDWLRNPHFSSCSYQTLHGDSLYLVERTKTGWSLFRWGDDGPDDGAWRLVTTIVTEDEQGSFAQLIETQLPSLLMEELL